MRKSYRFLTAFLLAGLFALTAFAQNVTISGTVKNKTSNEMVPAVSVVVKGTGKGTFTNSNGEFSLKVAKLPVVLVFTSAGGYDPTEITVSDASLPVSVELNVSTIIGNEVVISANRIPQRILDAPVTVERLSSSALRNVAAPNYYEAIANLRGVDMHTASLTFRTPTTRGFSSSGNTRMNQLIDGMDNQAPGLNFSVGSIIGLTELDVDNIELLSGASSALYGSGGMNGTLLLTSKNPFRYQGFSYNIKQGIMHIDERQQPKKSPYYDWSFRWAKAWNNKWALKLAMQLTQGQDWQAEDYRNKQQIGILSKVVGGNRTSDPNFNGINLYGDETSANMNGFSFFVQDQTRRSILALGGPDVVAAANNYFGVPGDPTRPGAIGLNPYPTNAQIATFLGALAAGGLPGPAVTAVQQMLPFFIGLNRNYFHNQSISRTGYEEELLVDYNTLNVKLTAGLHWKLSEKVEASWNSYFGTGTTVYTGADRYSLRNLKMAQHKLEFRAKNWFARLYTTQENAGQSYNATAVGAFLNEAYSPSGTWFPTYIATFSEMRRLGGTAQSDITIHNNVRAIADANRLLPGTPAFDVAVKKIKTTPIVKGGALFLDRSDLYAAEAQLNLSDAMHFSDVIEVLTGLSNKQWVMNSKGTIFADNVDSVGYTKVKPRGNITISETGAYVQLIKRLANDALTLTASGRYDKQTNFKGKFTPRLTAVIRIAKDNNIRVSYQTAYRFPTNQNQYISLITGSGALIGALPEFQTFYKLNSTLPGYTAASVLSYRSGTIADSGRLVPAVFKVVKPETVKSFELGYKGIIGKKMFWDAYVYFSKYNDFLVSTAVVQSRRGPKFEVYSPFSSNNISYVQNSDQEVKALGWGIGLEYKLIKNYMLYGNVFSDKLKDVPASVVTFFNAPKYRFNIGLRNDNVCHNVGFNVVAKWQDNTYYEGTFVTGTLPYFTWVDAQISYRPPATKSVFRIGGTNLGNNYYRTGFGSPYVGGLYYISYGYNIN
jgi:outer membrane receptor protein involved in Fe transport